MGPEVVHEQFAKRLNAGDLEGLCALYEPEAVMVERDGTLLKGVPAIRATLAGLLSIKPTITIQSWTIPGARSRRRTPERGHT